MPFKKLMKILAPGAGKAEADVEKEETERKQKEDEERKRKKSGFLAGRRGMSGKEFEELEKASR